MRFKLTMAVYIAFYVILILIVILLTVAEVCLPEAESLEGLLGALRG